MQKLCNYSLSLQKRLIQVCLFNPILKRTHLLLAYSHRTRHPKLIPIQYDLQIQLATIMNTVDDNCHEVMQLEGDSTNPIAYCDIRYPFHLSGDFLEEEMSLFSGNFRKSSSISIDLSRDLVFRILVIKAIVIIFRFHPMYLLDIFTLNALKKVGYDIFVLSASFL